jgi:ubiquinol-cytochrome c reductase cytochrome b subunit
VWYFTPYYAMLRAIPDKLMGVVVMGAAVMILFTLPWLDRSPVRSIRYRGPITKIALALFTVSFVTLGWLGLQSGSELQKLVAQVCTAIYFLFFLLMPVYTKMDSVKPVPDRVTMHD